MLDWNGIMELIIHLLSNLYIYNIITSMQYLSKSLYFMWHFTNDFIKDLYSIFFIFSDFRPTTLGKKQEKIRLRVYKIYAWGFPLLITIIAAIMDNLPDSQNLLRPRFGEKKCWFVGKCCCCSTTFVQKWRKKTCTSTFCVLF